MDISTQFNIKKKTKAYGKLTNKLVITELSNALQETAHWLALQIPKESEFWKTWK